MSRTLVLFWVGTAASQTAHGPDLESWAAARNVTLSAPPPHEAHRVPYDAEAVARVEALLLEARAALDAGDPAAAEAGLSSASTLLDRHAVPQAAWLQAEIHLLESERLAETDPAAARHHRERARLLGWEPSAKPPLDGADGGDGTATSAPSEAGRPGSAPDSQRAARIAGLRAGDVPYVDGIPRSEIPPGRHHLRVLRDRFEVYSGWVVASGPFVRVITSSPPPCSQPDLSSTHIEGRRVVPPPFATCPTWAVAREASGSIEVAMCHDHFCGPLLPWHAEDGRRFSGVAQPRHERDGFPAWLGWTIAGVAAATTTSVVLWQTGAFDEAEPRTTRFVVVPPERSNAP